MPPIFPRLAKRWGYHCKYFTTLPPKNITSTQDVTEHVWC